MNDFKYHYLFTSFDLESFEMEDFRYNFVNITAFRLVDTNDVFVKDVFKEMEQYSKQNHIKFKKNIAVEVRMKFWKAFHLSFVAKVHYVVDVESQSIGRYKGFGLKISKSPTKREHYIIKKHKNK